MLQLLYLALCSAHFVPGNHREGLLFLLDQSRVSKDTDAFTQIADKRRVYRAGRKEFRLLKYFGLEVSWETWREPDLWVTFLCSHGGRRKEVRGSVCHMGHVMTVYRSRLLSKEM